MKILELNAGAGGLALGLKRAGLEPTWAVDNDPEACASYARNVGHAPVQLDLRELLRLLTTGICEPAPIDLLIADPPCTPWSRAGARKGLQDDRDTLSVTFELITVLRPKAFLLGNIPGLDDAPNHRQLQRLLQTIADRYCVDYQAIDAAAYGTPQHRRRPFWFGHRPSLPHLRWPKRTHGALDRQLSIASSEQLAPFVTCRDALGHLSAADLGRPVSLRQRACNGKQHGSVPEKPALVVGTSNSDDNVLLVHPKHPISTADKPSRTITTKGDGRGAQGGCALEWPWEAPATTLRARDELSQKGGQSRNAIRLSERAGAILQGFPDDAVFVGRTKRSRWSQIGQALPPQVGEAIGRSLVRWFSEIARLGP